jgi:hypothetical protein
MPNVSEPGAPSPSSRASRSKLYTRATRFSDEESLAMDDTAVLGAWPAVGYSETIIIQLKP